MMGNRFTDGEKQASCGCYLRKVKFPLNGREWPTGFLLAGCGEEFVSLPLLSLGETHTHTHPHTNEDPPSGSPT